MKVLKSAMIYLLVFVIAMIPSCVAIAGGQVKDVKKGAVVPFDGILYDYDMSAKILIDKELATKKCELDIEYFVTKCEAKSKFNLEVLQIKFDSLEDMHNEMMEIKGREIELLREQIINSSDSRTGWWFAGGVILGAITTIAIVFAVNESR